MSCASDSAWSAAATDPAANAATSTAGTTTSSRRGRSTTSAARAAATTQPSEPGPIRSRIAKLGALGIAVGSTHESSGIRATRATAPNAAVARTRRRPGRAEVEPAAEDEEERRRRGDEVALGEVLDVVRREQPDLEPEPDGE